MIRFDCGRVASIGRMMPSTSQTNPATSGKKRRRRAQSVVGSGDATLSQHSGEVAASAPHPAVCLLCEHTVAGIIVSGRGALCARDVAKLSACSRRFRAVLCCVSAGAQIAGAPSLCASGMQLRRRPELAAACAVRYRGHAERLLGFLRNGYILRGSGVEEGEDADAAESGRAAAFPARVYRVLVDADVTVGFDVVRAQLGVEMLRSRDVRFTHTWYSGNVNGGEDEDDEEGDRPDAAESERVCETMPMDGAAWRLACLLSSVSRGVVLPNQWLPPRYDPRASARACTREADGSPPQVPSVDMATASISALSVNLELQLPGLGSPSPIIWPLRVR